MCQAALLASASCPAAASPWDYRHHSRSPARPNHLPTIGDTSGGLLRPPASSQRNHCDWSHSESSEEQPCGVWSDVVTATDGDRYSFANSHRARSDRRPECRDRWALLFAKADFLNGFSGPIFCSTLPAGDSITLVVCNSRGPLRNSARQN